MVLVLQPPPPNYKPDKTRRKRPTDNKRPLNQIAKPKPPSKSGSVEPQPNSTFQIGDGVQVKVEHFSISENCVTFELLTVLMEHIEIQNRLRFELQTDFMVRFTG